MASASSRPRRIAKQSILVWADANVQSNDSDTKKTLDKLRELVDDISLIKTPERCLEVLEEVEPTQCYVITSGAFGKGLVPQIHEIGHVEAIFVFCSNKSYHDQWAREWTKIRGVHTKIEPICEELRPILKQVLNDDIAMSIISRDNGDQPDLKQLPPSFMYSGMLKDVFLDMKFGQNHIDKLVATLLTDYAGKAQEMNIIQEFAKTYRHQKAIWWYTRECFTYKYVNRGLRELDADIIVDMGFFIADLHKQIKQLYDEQLPTLGRKAFTVYRGQGMLKEEFLKLRKSKNGLLSFNCFLSTSKKPEKSLEFAEGGATRPGHVGLFFIININTALRVVPFADIAEHSYYKTEAEILFTMHSIFKINSIEQHSSHSNIFQVQLELTDEDDPKLLGLKKHIADKYGSLAGYRLGRTLIDMGEHDKAEEVYLDLLKKETNERGKGMCNHCLGIIKDSQGRYQEAIEYYQKALEFDRRALSKDDPSIASHYGQIGLAYTNMGKYSEALDNYTKAVRIQEKVLPKNHPDLATSYNNIGEVYREMGYNRKALAYYEKSLEIKKITLPENHPTLATPYNNIGLVYNEMGDYQKTLTYYEKSLEILKKALPENHHTLASSYNNIGSVYDDMGDYQKALTYYEKSLEIRKKTLSENHPDLATSYHNMGCLFYNMKKYKQALEYLEEARRIKMISFPPTHPEIKNTNNWIEKAKREMN